jgi:carbamoyl-phosphate synthase large subunit
VNVLLSCAGRRGSLVKAFRSRCERRNGCVVASDADGLAPSLFLAHKAAVTPPLCDPAYSEALLRLVREHRIGLLVPTIDTELPLLAELDGDLRKAGCSAAVSSAPFISICADKWLTYLEFSAAGIRMPRSWLPDDLKPASAAGPLFVKPRDGSASRDTFETDGARLNETLSRVPNAIIQERVSGQEITVDALTDFNGRLVHYVPRLRIRTLGGESIQGVTLADAEFREWLTNVLEVCLEMGAAGPLTLQFFKTDDGPVLSEINPRFGGGFPLSLAAGADYPEWLMQMVEGRTIDAAIGHYRAGLYMTRYYHDEFVSEPVAHVVRNAYR